MRLRLRLLRNSEASQVTPSKHTSNCKKPAHAGVLQIQVLEFYSDFRMRMLDVREDYGLEFGHFFGSGGAQCL